MVDSIKGIIPRRDEAKPSAVQPWGGNESMNNNERIFIKEGSAIQNLNEPRHDASAWIQDTIDKLISFKQRVDDGHVIIMGGDYNETHPAPDREQVTYDYISLSIDFVETKSQNRTE
ncbi:hypothetical protein [Enterococcus casseliflavus]|uniref:hypothetical protein n=1 Tax=Enterococcus casseliflavus TaxID=37734 RepID=UPI003D6A81E9